MSKDVHVSFQFLTGCKSASLKLTPFMCALKLSLVVSIVLVEVALAIENAMTGLTGVLFDNRSSNS